MSITGKTSYVQVSFCKCMGVVSGSDIKSVLVRAAKYRKNMVGHGRCNECGAEITNIIGEVMESNRIDTPDGGFAGGTTFTIDQESQPHEDQEAAPN